MVRRKNVRKFFSFNRFDYLFFDFDGVILDSVNVKTQAFKKMYSQYGADVAQKVVKHHVANGGVSRFKKFKLYHKNFLGKYINDEEVRLLAKKFSRIVFKKVLKAKYIAGSYAFLRKCKNFKKKCFIVSGTPEKEIISIIKAKKLNNFFEQVKGSPTEKHRHVAKLIEMYKIDRKRAIFFGDSMSDKKAAKLNKINFIGINFPLAPIVINDFNVLLN